MTPEDFCNWLDGYLEGAKHPDASVIKAKARQIHLSVRIAPTDVWPLNPIPVIGPYIQPQTVPYPRIGDFWCGTSSSVVS